MNRLGRFLLFAVTCGVLALQPHNAKVLPQTTPFALSFVILHDKQYAFSPWLFDGTPDLGRMVLTARIKNESPFPVTISTVSEGVISVVFIVHEAAKVRPHLLDPVEAPVSFDEDPIFIASGFLVTLAPQASQDIPIRVINRFVIPNPGEPTEFQYTPPGIGTYTMVFEYSYIGSDNNFPNVFHGAIRSQPITVQVN